MRKDEKIMIVANGKMEKLCDRAGQIPGQIFVRMWDLRWLGIDALKNRIEETIKLSEGFLEGVGGSRVLKSMKMMLEIEDKEKIIIKIYDLILSSENFGLLPGFGYAICEKSEDGKRRISRRLPGNPEKDSIRNFDIF